MALVPVMVLEGRRRESAGLLDVLAGILGLLGDLLAPTPAIGMFWIVFPGMALLVVTAAISYGTGAAHRRDGKASPRPLHGLRYESAGGAAKDMALSRN